MLNVWLVGGLLAKIKNISHNIFFWNHHLDGLSTYIWIVLGVNVGKYTIHWAAGVGIFPSKSPQKN